jgi:hypothetical protein
MLWHIESRGDVACLTMQEVMRMNTVDTVGVGDEKHRAFGIRCRRVALQFTTLIKPRCLRCSRARARNVSVR